MAASAGDEPGDFVTRLAAALTQLAVPERPAARLLVAFSGGLDSTVLLHTLIAARGAHSVVAAHVDHGLHADSAAWAEHCRRVASEAGAGFVSRRLAIAPDARGSLEAAAREARYRTLAEWTGPGDVVLTAHHADDQLETVLLRLMRGTGVRGLTAIHARASFARGVLVRPLLGFARAEIRREAHRRGLAWLEDPSNADRRFDRNFLRAECLPALLARWPSAGRVANRLAGQMAETLELLAGLAQVDLAGVADPACLPVDRLLALDGARRRNAIRYAVGALALPLPSAAQLAEVERILTARDDAVAVVHWPGAEARIFHGHLYLLAPQIAGSAPSGQVGAERVWHGATDELRLVAADGYGIPDRWACDGLDVRFRHGGERFRPYRSAHHKTLKHWFQEAGIVPWMRERVPLLYRDDRLIAVGDLCLADDLPQSEDDAPFWRPVWTGHARLR
jgi:tRNA(Ile)-lysidine synthase